MVGHVAHTMQKGNVRRVFVGKLEGHRPHGNPRRGQRYNIKMDLKHTGCKGVDRYASGYGELEGCCQHNKYHIVVCNNTNKMHTSILQIVLNTVTSDMFRSTM